MIKKFKHDFGVFCCPHVFRNKKPVLRVIRDQQGNWEFLCGENHAADDRHHIGVGRLLQRDPTLDVMVALSVSTGAKREDVLQDWEYFRLTESLAPD